MKGAVFSKVIEKYQGFIDWWKDYFKVLVLSYTRISRDNVNILASGMVYSTLISIVPCITFLFAFLSVFGVLQTFLEMLTAFLVETLGETTGHEIAVLVETYTGNALSLGVFGIISFLITSILLINKVYTVMNRIFRTQPRSGPLKRFTTFLTLLIVAAIIIVVIISIQGRLERTIVNSVRLNTLVLASSNFWERLIIVGVLWVGIFSLIFFLPNAKIRFSSAFVGSLTGLVAILIATGIFKRIIVGSVNYSVIYGSLASILFLLIYFYLFWYIIMVSAEITYVHQFRPDKGLIKGRPESPLSQISEGVNLVLLVADKYRSGNGATTEKELVRKLAIPSSRLYGYINCLEDGKIIMAVNTQRSAFVPALPLDKIYLKEVLHVLYGSERKTREDIQTMGEAVAQEMEDKGIKGLEDISIENLMERL